MRKKRNWLPLLAVLVMAVLAMTTGAFAAGEEAAEYVSPFHATAWSLLPPVIAIGLALITKEVYSSLFIGILAGGLTLVVMILPTIIRTTQESLKTVPQSYREGALGLGAGKWHMIRTVVLPNAVDGIVTGCILAVGRIVGESAALLFTAGFGTVLYSFAQSLNNSSATLTVALYLYANERGETEIAFAIAAILMILTLVINLAAGLVGRRLKK